MKCPRLTPIYEKLPCPKSFKLQRSRQWKLRSVFITHALNRLFNPVDHCAVPSQFTEGYSITACMAILLSIPAWVPATHNLSKLQCKITFWSIASIILFRLFYLTLKCSYWRFICNFSIWSTFINRYQTWSMYGLFWNLAPRTTAEVFI